MGSFTSEIHTKLMWNTFAEKFDHLNSGGEQTKSGQSSSARNAQDDRQRKQQQHGTIMI